MQIKEAPSPVVANPECLGDRNAATDRSFRIKERSVLNGSYTHMRGSRFTQKPLCALKFTTNVTASILQSMYGNLLGINAGFVHYISPGPGCHIGSLLQLFLRNTSVDVMSFFASFEKIRHFFVYLCKSCTLVYVLVKKKHTQNPKCESC